MAVGTIRNKRKKLNQPAKSNFRDQYQQTFGRRSRAPVENVTGGVPGLSVAGLSMLANTQGLGQSVGPQALPHNQFRADMSRGGGFLGASARHNLAGMQQQQEVAAGMEDRFAAAHTPTVEQRQQAARELLANTLNSPRYQGRVDLYNRNLAQQRARLQPNPMLEEGAIDRSIAQRLQQNRMDAPAIAQQGRARQLLSAPMAEPGPQPMTESQVRARLAEMQAPGAAYASGEIAPPLPGIPTNRVRVERGERTNAPHLIGTDHYGGPEGAAERHQANIQRQVARRLAGRGVDPTGMDLEEMQEANLQQRARENAARLRGQMTRAMGGTLAQQAVPINQEIANRLRPSGNESMTFTQAQGVLGQYADHPLLTGLGIGNESSAQDIGRVITQRQQSGVPLSEGELEALRQYVQARIQVDPDFMEAGMFANPVHQDAVRALLSDEDIKQAVDQAITATQKRQQKEAERYDRYRTNFMEDVYGSPMTAF